MKESSTLRTGRSLMGLVGEGMLQMRAEDRESAPSLWSMLDQGSDSASSRREWHKVVNGLSSGEMSTCLAGRSIYLIGEHIPELRISQIHVWCKGVTLLWSEMDRERYRVRTALPLYHKTKNIWSWERVPHFIEGAPYLDPYGTLAYPWHPWHPWHGMPMSPIAPMSWRTHGTHGTHSVPIWSNKRIYISREETEKSDKFVVFISRYLESNNK